jgi:putative nucleotidyltransferase with HDIG domain
MGLPWGRSHRKPQRPTIDGDDHWGGGGTTLERLTVASMVLGISLLHFLSPTEAGIWHGLHLLAQQLYYVPIIAAAAWLGVRGALLTVASVSVLYGVHTFLDWSGEVVVQAHQVVEMTSYWIAAGISAWLFGRVRRELRSVRHAHGQILSALARSLELRESGTARHSERVRDYALLLAGELGIRDRAFLRDLARGAFLHDVGKLGIPDRILLSEGALTEVDAAVIRKHPDWGAELIGSIDFLRKASELVRSHHERFDGAGYPRGLAGEQILLEARIFAVADAFDVLTTDRSYQPAVPFERAVERIVEGRGTQFDPRVVDAFLRVPFQTWRDLAGRHGVSLQMRASGSLAQSTAETLSGGPHVSKIAEEPSGQDDM